ncbi:MAG: GNAT family N-acetyltransferase [Alphaproteobacteria bacterium]|nr:GNAT family N-acetyltransferase [Alphaproteobacteria bacterium]
MKHEPNEAAGLNFVTYDRVGAIDAAAWNNCLNADKNPFLRHEFLTACEESGSGGGATGWHPMPMVAYDQASEIVGVVPLYRKDHSYGEYVFDQEWAAAFAAAGGNYYPKLQIAVPFTPVVGARLLCAAKSPVSTKSALLSRLKNLCHEQGYSGLHATFVDEDGASAFLAAGYLPRYDYQFHFHNRAYENFDGFLAELTHRKRKAIKKERAAAAQLGLNIVTLSGEEMTAALWDGFYACYRATSGRKWGKAYLTRDFFVQIGDVLGTEIVMVLALDGEKIVAGAINFRGGDILYGRNWGCLEEIPYLHFECCYYRAIDYAIAHKLSRVEAGAQGFHKIKRGYLPTRTTSFHYLAHQGLSSAVADFLTDERLVIDENILMLAQESPYREEG